jgi:hypothetical protein
MMDMGDMADRCMDEMGSMMGGGMMGSSLWLVVVLLLAIFLVWLVGLGAVGALIFWGVLGRQEALQAARIETPGGEMRSTLRRVYDAYVTRLAGELPHSPEEVVKAEPNVVSY